MSKQNATLWPLNESGDRWVAHIGGERWAVLGSGVWFTADTSPRYMIQNIDQLDELLYALHEIRPAMIAAELGTTLDEEAAPPDYYTSMHGDGTQHGDAIVTVAPYDEHVLLEVTEPTKTAGVMIAYPDDARRIAVRLVREAQALEDRLDIHDGNGGDQ